MYNPSKKDLTLFGSMTVDELNASPDMNLTRSSLRAALRFFMQAGAIKKSWLEKQDMLTETLLTSETIDEKIRDLITPHVGENGDTEDLIQTLERVIEERDNVKRNRERPVRKP